MTRVCKDCGMEFPLSEEFFHKRTDRGVVSFRKECRECKSKKAKTKYEQDNKETIWEREKRFRREDEEHIRVCSKCQKEWELSEKNFTKSSKSRHGLNTVCKECVLAYSRTRHNTEEQKLINSAIQRAYRKTDKYKNWHQNYVQKEEVKDAKKVIYEKRKKDGKLAKYDKEFYHKNPKNKLRKTMSVNFRTQLNNINTLKPLSTMKFIGCSVEELHVHLNNGEYTLEHYKNSEYHCDHIIPSVYYLKKLEIDAKGNITEETKPWLYKWWNYRNLRIWPAKPNMSKSDDMDQELIAKHGIEDLLTL